LIEWANSGGNFILEDDYDSELRYLGKPIPSLQGLRPNGNIVYLGTFSKVLSPALRLSYLVLPRSLLVPYRRLFRDYFATVSILEQKTLAKFMEQGHWERHVRRMRIIYKQKHHILLQAIAHHFGGKATVVGQGAGLHVVLQLPADNPGETEIIQRAEQKGIHLLPFSGFHVSGKPDSTNLLLGFGGMTADRIEEGVVLLSRLCG
jgi:GntR family transcriptional regulator / MocR family aminotransferase